MEREKNKPISENNIIDELIIEVPEFDKLQDARIIRILFEKGN